MIYVLTTCAVVIGMNQEFENAFREINLLYQKQGAKLIGFWWSLIGEGNEAVWIYSWDDLKDFEKGKERVWKDKDFPLEKIATTVITYNDKVLKSSTIAPTK